MRSKVRRLRHWKQRFDPNAAFVWRKVITWQGETTVPGKEIPKELLENRAKLRRFWEAQTIELAEFEAPDVVTGQVPDKVEPKKDEEIMLLGSSIVPSEVQVHGETITLGEIVALAFEGSELSAEEWNALPEQERDEKLGLTISMMLDLGEEETPSDEDEEMAGRAARETAERLAREEAEAKAAKEPQETNEGSEGANKPKETAGPSAEEREDLLNKLLVKESAKEWRVKGVEGTFKTKKEATARANQRIDEHFAAKAE